MRRSGVLLRPRATSAWERSLGRPEAPMPMAKATGQPERCQAKYGYPRALRTTSGTLNSAQNTPATIDKFKHRRQWQGGPRRVPTAAAQQNRLPCLEHE
eukprot:3925904-Pyramimonas_sp.AAC.1